MESLVREHFPSWLAMGVKRWISIPRFWKQVWAARRSFQRHGPSYSHPLLFIAGLPKSGTSWMESMLASYPGYKKVMPAEAIRHEQKHKGSHDYQLTESTFSQLQDALVVLKLHVSGSPHNIRLLREANVPYIVMYRDLRDVAVSHYFYVRRTPWHPEFEDYSDLDVEKGIRHFRRTLLPDFVNWMRTWRENRDREQSIELRYEDLLDDTAGEFRRVASHFSLDTSPQTIEDIVEKHSFENMSGGRTRGEQDSDSFARRGVAGDWKRHFTPALKEQFKTQAGQLLIDLGYETDHSW
ncbi:sulfotransferase domain-containing protein [Salinibacter ruber]|uniref:sulfotransferase domain-containing protein n=1 Tax=Salinibacter ruber TaxID=146919 RepID=UPI002073968F|nr:sulfotransferase domain-containing protein [Salinibacter ruber]